MTPRPLSRSIVRVLAAALLLDGGLAGACLHGAKGNEQTSVVNDGVRVDRIRMQPDSKQILKVFVGPKGLKKGKSISGIVLAGDDAVLHKDLATEAASIGREGQPLTRGLSKGFGFDGIDVPSELTELTAADYPDWAAVVSKLNIASRGPQYDAAYTSWLRALRSAGRAAYALQVDASAGPMPMLAIKIAYPGADNIAEIVSDKMFETAAADDVPNITWFKGLSNEALDKAVGLVATAAKTSELGQDFAYDLAGVGTAKLRSRTWHAYDAAAKKEIVRTGVLWMK